MAPKESDKFSAMCDPSMESKKAYLRQRSSTTNASTNGTRQDGSNINQQNEPSTTMKNDDTPLKKDDSSSTSLYFNMSFLLLISYGSLEFARWFPYQLAPEAAVATYVPAAWRYDEFETRFDNSVWTWGTDYGLCVIFSYAAYRCINAVATGVSQGGISSSSAGREASARLRALSAGLVTFYAISVFAGGWAHQHYKTLDSLNTTTFRIIWTICVGTVTAAGGFIGAIGSEVARSFRGKRWANGEIFSPPAFPDWFWAGWAVYMTAACVVGGISYKRPACDIFIAGTTQFIPTVHCVSSLFVRNWADGKKVEGQQQQQKASGGSVEVRRLYRIFYYVGFFFNAPLLPSYPLLVQYTTLPLGAVNSLLHLWLLCGWGMQALSLHHLSLALSSSGVKPSMTSSSSSFFKA